MVKPMEHMVVSMWWWFPRNFKDTVSPSETKSGWPLVLICTDMYFLYWYGKCTAKCTAKTPNFEDVLIKCTDIWIFLPHSYQGFAYWGDKRKKEKKKIKVEDNLRAILAIWEWWFLKISPTMVEILRAILTISECWYWTFLQPWWTNLRANLSQFSE